MRMVYEGPFGYQGYFGRESKCWLRLFVAEGRNALAIATELRDNPGTSVTNRAEELATAVLWMAAVEHRAARDGLTWIEHYPGDPRSGEAASRKDRYSQVVFDWDPGRRHFTRPRWHHTSRGMVECLLGQSIGQVPSSLAEAPSTARALSLVN